MQELTKSALALFGISMVLTVQAQVPASSVQASSAVGSQERLRALLLDSGAQLTGRAPWEFRLESGSVVSLQFEGATLAAVRVSCADTDASAEPNSPEQERSNAKQLACAFPEVEYRVLIDLIGRLKEMGSFIGTDPMGIVPTSGWTRWTDVYSKSRLVRLERRCDGLIPSGQCGVTAFSVYYPLLTEGIVEGKEVRSIDLLGAKVARYFAIVAGKEVELRAEDYNRLECGDTAKLERTLDGGPAVILELRKGSGSCDRQ